MRLVERSELWAPAIEQEQQTAGKSWPLPACHFLACQRTAIAGWPGLAISPAASLSRFGHETLCVNALAHVVGRQHYVTGDQSRNNSSLSRLTMGEGWHNNHHAYQA